MSTMRWSEPSLPEDGGIGSTPTIKNHSVTYHRGLLYCFGGYDGRRNNQTLLIYSLREGKWIAPADPNGFGGRGLIGSNNNVSTTTTRHDIMFGGQYHVPPGRNGHTATLATNRRSRSLRTRRNNNVNDNIDFQQEQQQQQQQQAGDGMDDSFSDAAENLQGGDVMPNLPANNGGESSMETDNNDDDDDEEAQIIIIGGWLGSGPLAASDTWVLDVSGGIDRLRWFSPPVRGTPPGPCNMHSADFIPSRGEVYVFRGGNGREYLNDLHALDTTSYVWRTVETTGEAPQQRANHSSAVLELNGTTELYVFGGWNGTERLNDVHILDTETSTWSTPRISGSRPHPRAGMSLTALRGRLYLFGGSGTSSKCFDDLQIFDRKEMAWLDVNEEEQQQHSSNQSSPSRYDNTERDVYPSWGGLSGQDGMMDGDRNSNRDSMFTDWRSQEGMYSPSHQSHSVNPNDEDMVASVLVTGKPPGKRAGHTATAVGRRIYVFGGSCGTDYLNDFFVLDTDPPPLMKLTESTCPDLVARRLKYFYNEEEFADVIFLVEGREVYGHKLVLSSVSDCFRAMFMGQFKESGSGCTRIDIPNCTYSSFIALMEYIYTGRAPELDVSSALDRAISLLELADQFFLYNLKQICEKELCECVNAETFAFLLQIAQKTNASQLESYCRYFERNHQNEMNNF